ncbi:GDSL-type esterase/lipase family protein [Roseococcus sp. SYP-B2431]|uniref:SGNH/GDSL hydrolase family protein n=1 Tax=Roseococcus sp. SYP-B2431 TaxID=2496640 RepID=UPI0013F49E7C|nr:GDSL-type esterase/lipase family protein [Roseococcus sp. SYP-B2431]
MLLASATSGSASMGGCPRVSLTLPPLHGLRAEIAAGRPVTIVALGSSSTEGAGASRPEAAYPALLETLLRRALPGREVSVINAGRSGETTAEMLARLDRDVLAHRPGLVVWQAGANEALKDSDPAVFAAQVQAGLGRLDAAGVAVVLMDNQRAPRILQAAGSARFPEILSRLARERRVALFPRGWLMSAWAEGGLPSAEVLSPDGLHHNDRGYACLAEALAGAVLEAVGVRTMVAGR